MRPLFCVLTVVIATALASPALAQNLEARELVLDNGMTFLLCPRDEEPNTITAGWVAKVGSVNERPGITGISHFFEHMMFKGTTTIGTDDPAEDAAFMEKQEVIKSRINDLVWNGQYARYRKGEIGDPWDPANDTPEIRDLRGELRQLMEDHRGVIVENEFDRTYKNEGGAGMNAFTSNDVTFYFITLPSNKFELWAWMESDRLTDSVFREFYAERDVVHEERRMRLESSPTGRLEEQFDAMFWTSSPYSWSVIGWPSDLNSYTREQFDEYFNVYYRPNNLVGIVVGDFDLDEVEAYIQTYFGRLTRGEKEPTPVVTLEVEQLAEKRLIGECDCQSQIEIRYHTVPFNHRDSFTFDILTEILNERTGRLYKRMIEGAEIASSAAARQESWKYAGFFSFSAEVKGDATPVDLEAAWLAEVERLKNEPVPAQELQKVKNRVEADSFRGLQNNTMVLFQLGMYEAMDEWEYINESPAKRVAVTPEDIRRVAQTYFIPTNRSVAVYTRRAGAESETDELASFAPEDRDRIKIMLERLATREDPNELRQIVGALEAQLGSMPDEVRPSMEYVVKKLHERLAELEGN